MTAARRQPANLREDLDRALATFRIMADAVLSEADDLHTRFSEHDPAASHQIAMWHAREALRGALGLGLPRAHEAKVRRAYKLISRELGVEA